MAGLKRSLHHSVAAICYTAGLMLGQPGMARPQAQDSPPGQVPPKQVLSQQTIPEPGFTKEGSTLPPCVSGNGVSPPIPVYTPDPPYTPEARRARVEGTVSLRAVVDTDGKLRHAHLTKLLGLGLDELALETVKTWKFKPALRDGNPVPFCMLVEVTFRPFSPPPPADRFFAAGKDAIPPQSISAPNPHYTRKARHANLQGTVLMAVVVDKKGRVTDVTEIGPELGMGLDEAAIKTVRKWKYRPATRNGKPVGARVKVELTFKL